MKTIKNILRCFFCPTLALILVASSAAVAFGTTIKIKPDKLKKVISVQEDLRYPFVVKASPFMENAKFYYLLKLPVGTKFKGMEYQHGGTAASSNTAVSIIRAKADASPALQLILQGRSTEYTVSGINFVWVQAEFYPGAVRRFRKGWTYFVYVECEDEYSLVGDVKVFYE